jgi:hypothetical protein
MRSARGVTAAVAALLICSAVGRAALPAASSAATGSLAAGSFEVTSIVPTSPPRPTAGGGCLSKLTATFVFFDGTLEGSFTAPFVFLRNGACDEPAAQTFVARGTFSGCVGAREGRFTFVFAGTVDATPVEAPKARGTLIVLSGSGGLRGLQGALELTGVAGVGGTYIGAVSI